MLDGPAQAFLKASAPADVQTWSVRRLVALLYKEFSNTHSDRMWTRLRARLSDPCSFWSAFERGLPNRIPLRRVLMEVVDLLTSHHTQKADQPEIVATFMRVLPLPLRQAFLASLNPSHQKKLDSMNAEKFEDLVKLFPHTVDVNAVCVQAEAVRNDQVTRDSAPRTHAYNSDVMDQDRQQREEVQRLSSAVASTVGALSAIAEHIDEANRVAKVARENAAPFPSSQHTTPSGNNRPERTGQGDRNGPRPSRGYNPSAGPTPRFSSDNGRTNRSNYGNDHFQEQRPGWNGGSKRPYDRNQRWSDDGSRSQGRSSQRDSWSGSLQDNIRMEEDHARNCPHCRDQHVPQMIQVSRKGKLWCVLDPEFQRENPEYAPHRAPWRQWLMAHLAPEGLRGFTPQAFESWKAYMGKNDSDQITKLEKAKTSTFVIERKREVAEQHRRRTSSGGGSGDARAASSGRNRQASHQRRDLPRDQA